MTVGKSRQQLIRQRIAAAAARMIAEDGIGDYALAKRKAARQLGLDEAHSLPGNDEVDAELRAYQALYLEDEQPECLAELRAIALDLMEELEKFRPYLVGPVLKGTAGRFSEIDLQLFTDDPKAVEFHLLNRRIPYDVSQQKRFSGDQSRAVAVLKLEREGVPVNVAIFTANDERATVRSSPGGRAIERASLPALIRLLEEEADEGTDQGVDKAADETAGAGPERR